MDLTRRRSVVSALAVVLAVAMLWSISPGCDEDRTEGPVGPTRDRPLCLTTSWPLESLLKEIAGEQWDVRCVLPLDRDVREWAPSREVLAELSTADLICLQGAGLELWAVRAGLPRDRRVVLAAPFRDEWLKVEHAVTHRHGQGEVHTHQGFDPHVWFDPRLVALMARAFGDAAIGAAPERAEAIERNTRAVLERLERIGERFDRLRSELGARTIVADHPSFHYLANRLGWRYVELHGPRTEDSDPIGRVDLVLTEPGADEAQVLSRLRAAGGTDAPVLEIDPGAVCAIGSKPIALLDWLESPPDRITAPLR